MSDRHLVPRILRTQDRGLVMRKLSYEPRHTTTAWVLPNPFPISRLAFFLGVLSGLLNLLQLSPSILTQMST